MASEIVGEKREGTAGVRKQGANKISFVSQWHFLIETDDVSVSREEVLFGTPGAPVVGLVYGAVNATCTAKNVTRRAVGSRYWDMVCDFDTAAEDQKKDPSNESDDPRTWIPIFIIDGFEQKLRVLTVDKSSTPKTCTNSANQPFAEPVTESVTICSYSFTQFEDPSQDINTIMDRNDCVNSVVFKGRPIRTLKLNTTSAELGYFGNVPAWRIGYRVSYDRDTWDDKRLDVGPMQLDGTGLKPCMDSTNTFRIVGNLNGSGIQQSQTIAPYVITFKPHTAIDFNTLIRV